MLQAIILSYRWDNSWRFGLPAITSMSWLDFLVVPANCAFIIPWLPFHLSPKNVPRWEDESDKSLTSEVSE